MTDTQNQPPEKTDSISSETLRPETSSGSTMQLPQNNYTTTLTPSSTVDHQTDQPQSNAGPLEGLHILVAEDCEITQIVFETMLEQFGCVIQVVENGQQAVEAIQDGSFDIILMDGQMPVMDGYTAAELIRKAEGSNVGRIPILAVSASTLPDDKQRSHDCGMNEFMSKPLKEEQLQDMLLRNLPGGDKKAA